MGMAVVMCLLLDWNDKFIGSSGNCYDGYEDDGGNMVWKLIVIRSRRQRCPGMQHMTYGADAGAIGYDACTKICTHVCSY